MSLYDKTIISDRSVYEQLKARGVDALFWNRSLELSHPLRIEIQQELFGRGNHQSNNQKFYRYAWGKKQEHRCEECCRPLPAYSATYISHIQSRGAHPETAYDLRNFNYLCPECHAKWENGDRESMRIWTRNNSIIKTLKKEYATENQI